MRRADAAAPDPARRDSRSHRRRRLRHRDRFVQRLSIDRRRAVACRAAPAASVSAAASSPASNPAAPCGSKRSRRSARRSSSSPGGRTRDPGAAARASRPQRHRCRPSARTHHRPRARRGRPAPDSFRMSGRAARRPPMAASGAGIGSAVTIGPERVAPTSASRTEQPVLTAADYGPWHIDYSAHPPASRASSACARPPPILRGASTSPRASSNCRSIRRSTRCAGEG